MTEELFREDAYAKRCEAEVTAALDCGVCLNRTVFYCQGGGQPGDRGRLLLAGGAALEVVDTIRPTDVSRIGWRTAARRPRSAPAWSPRSTGRAGIA
jgi:misacylated tRNA(Ala) deacylase